jgi:hypothetical protein
MSDDETDDERPADRRSSRFREISSRLDRGESDEDDDRDLTEETSDNESESWEWIDDYDESNEPAAPDESKEFVDIESETDDTSSGIDSSQGTQDESSVEPEDSEGSGDDESRSRVWNTDSSGHDTVDTSEPDDNTEPDEEFNREYGNESEVETDDKPLEENESPFEVVDSSVDGTESSATTSGKDDEQSSMSAGENDPIPPDQSGPAAENESIDDIPSEVASSKNADSREDEGTSTTTTQPEQASTETEEREERERKSDTKKRIWSSSGTTRDTESSDLDISRDRDENPTPMDAFDDVSDDPDGYEPPRGLNTTPQTSVLVQCGSQDDRKDAACDDLLGLSVDGTERSILLIQYRKVDPTRLERITEESRRTKLISIGYSQRIPGSIEDEIETVKINNPNDITRLGILVSGTLDDWTSADEETAVCYDSLNVLLKYKDVQSTFRFLHVFLGTLDSANAISHFHVDPLAGDPQNINTLKPLFDEVVSIDSMGVHLE